MNGTMQRLERLPGSTSTICFSRRRRALRTENTTFRTSLGPIFKQTTRANVRTHGSMSKSSASPSAFYRRVRHLQHRHRLSLTKSTEKMVQTNRQLVPPPPGGMNRSVSTSSASSRPSVSRSASTLSTSSYKKAPPPPPGASLSRSATSASAAPPPYSSGGSSALTSAAATKRAPPPPPPLKPKPSFAPPVQYVVALYDFVAQADGDLSFSAGARIEIVERTTSAEDWWTGRVDGAQGVFPGDASLILILTTWLIFVFSRQATTFRTHDDDERETQEVEEECIVRIFAVIECMLQLSMPLLLCL